MTHDDGPPSSAHRREKTFLRVSGPVSFSSRLGDRLRHWSRTEHRSRETIQRPLRQPDRTQAWSSSAARVLLFCVLWNRACLFSLMSPSFAYRVTATAVDIRRVFHGFALRAAIAAAFCCHTGARWMRAFIRFSLSHIGFPSLDRICLRSIDLLLLDAPAPPKATLPPEARALTRAN
jgi:hypothetical protein